MSVNRIGLLVGCVIVVAMGISAAFPGFWRTRDQRGLRALERAEFVGASELFEDRSWRAVAQYKAGEFELAAGSFAGIGTASSEFNRGNALVFLGRYDDAIASYELALERRPGWEAAMENLDIARSRRLDRSGGEGTGGKLGADEIVFDAGKKDSAGDDVDVGGEEPQYGASLNALWLRNVQTRPADFLRLKFAAQLSRRDAGENE